MTIRTADEIRAEVESLINEIKEYCQGLEVFMKEIAKNVDILSRKIENGMAEQNYRYCDKKSDKSP